MTAIPGAGQVLGVHVLESDTITLHAANLRAEPGASGQSCGALGYAVQRGHTRVAGGHVAWAESEGTLLAVSLEQRKLTIPLDGARDSLFLDVDFNVTVTLEVEAGDVVWLAAGLRDEMEMFNPTLSLRGDRDFLQPMPAFGTPFLCGVGLADFSPSYVVSGAPGAQAVIADDAAVTWTTNQGTFARLLLVAYPMAGQPIGHCALSIDLDERPKASATTTDGHCVVTWTGDPGTLSLNLDEVVAYSPLVSYSVWDAPSDAPWNPGLVETTPVSREDR
jgi:hypothetical protein